MNPSEFADFQSVACGEPWTPHFTLHDLPDLGAVARQQRDERQADAFCARLQQYIEGVFHQLPTGQQLEVYYFARSSAPILVNQLSYINPDIIMVFGLDVEGNRCSFAVHVTAMELEVRVRLIEGPIKRTTIGFSHPAPRLSPAQGNPMPPPDT